MLIIVNIIVIVVTVIVIFIVIVLGVNEMQFFSSVLADIHKMF